MSNRQPHLRISWDDLRLFLEIARSGTLTAAAARLKLSQPTAGRRLRTLEEAVGGLLFQRTASGFLLTDEGEAMLAHAAHMEEEALALERKLMGGAQGLEGMLRLSTSDWFAARVLAAPLADFSILHPAVTIEVLADFRMLDLQRREADIVFRFAPFREADIVQRRFVHIHYAVYASEPYLSRCGDPLASADGSSHHLVLMDSALDHLADVAWVRSRWPQARVSFRSNNREAQAVACVQGCGLAVLPCRIGDTLPLTRLGGEEPPGRDVWLGYHQDLRRLPRLRALVKHLTSTMPAEI